MSQEPACRSPAAIASGDGRGARYGGHRNQPKSRIFKSQQKAMKNQNAIGVGLALGAGMGVAIGAAVGAMIDDVAMGVALGVALGAGLGLAIGAVYGQMGGRDDR